MRCRRSEVHPRLWHVCFRCSSTGWRETRSNSSIGILFKTSLKWWSVKTIGIGSWDWKSVCSPFFVQKPNQKHLGLLGPYFSPCFLFSFLLSLTPCKQTILRRHKCSRVFNPRFLPGWPGFNKPKSDFLVFHFFKQPISAFVGLAHTISILARNNGYYTEPRNSVFLQILFNKEGAGIIKRLLKHNGQIKYIKQNKYV